jgi:hypothetical protein
MSISTDDNTGNGSYLPNLSHEPGHVPKMSPEGA